MSLTSEGDKPHLSPGRHSDRKSMNRKKESNMNTDLGKVASHPPPRTSLLQVLTEVKLSFTTVYHGFKLTSSAAGAPVELRH